MDGGPDFGDLVIFAGGIDAIGEQHNEQLAVGVDPDRCSSKSRVAVAMCGEIMSAGTAFCGYDPSERAGIFRQRLWNGKFSNSRTFYYAVMGIDAPIQQHLAEGGQIR